MPTPQLPPVGTLRARMSDAARDLSHAARSLRRSRGLVLVATLSLGLGIGVNATLYSAFRAIILEPPSAVRPERLVRIEPGNSNQISYPNLRDLGLDDALEGAAGYATMRRNLRIGDEVAKVMGMAVTPGWFDVLGVRPARGRAFAPAEDGSVVLTHELWMRRFGGRADILGATASLSGQTFVVIGVLPEGHRAVVGALGPDLYLPASEALMPGLGDRSRQLLTMIGRLRDGVSARQLQALATARTRALERSHPDVNEGMGRPAAIFPVSGLESLANRGTPAGRVAALATIPFVIFGLVLLIACANVAGLLYARGSERRREIAIRCALGASRAHVVRSLLAESVLLSSLGAGAGLALTVWLCRVLSAVTLPSAPRPVDISPDAGVLGYAVALVLVTAIACGLTPALAATRADVVDALKREPAEGRRRFAARNLLVGGEVALSMVLLFVSMLFLRSLAILGSIDPGFDVDRLLATHVDLEPARYDEGRRRDAAERMRQIVAAVPGVQAASLASLIPLGGDTYSTRYRIDGQSERGARASAMHVGPDYFRTMGTPTRMGREFSASDRDGAPPVAVVNEAFVRAYRLPANPLGARARSGDDDPWLEIVGVVADSKYAFLGEAPLPLLYRPYAQAGGNLFVVARTAGAPDRSASAVGRAILQVDPTAVLDVRTGRDAASFELSLRRMGAKLLGTVGSVGLLLALVGLYGLLAHAVSRRTREIGIRMALGASRPAVMRMVVRDGLSLVAAGIAAGTLLSLGASRLLGFLMSGVASGDPATLALTAALLLAAGLAASWLPGRRAARVDPMVSLRYD